MLIGIGKDKEIYELNLFEIKNSLVKNNLYPELASENDIEIILERAKDSPRFTNYYFSHKCLERDSNIKLLISKLKNQLPKSVEEINMEFVKSILNYLFLLGFESSSKKIIELGVLTIKSKLVNMNLYENTISEMDVEIIIKNIVHATFINYYFSDDCENKELNKNYIRSNQQFQNFLKGINIDGTKVSSKRIKTLLNKLGFTDTILDKEVNFRVVLSKWSEEEEKLLIELYRVHQQNLQHHLNIDNPFGRSISAVMSKLNFLINGQQEFQKQDKKQLSKGISHFPNSVFNYLHELISYSQIPIEYIKDQYPVISYYYPIDKQLTDESVFVVILPIQFKSVKFERYSPTEQLLIQFIQNKLLFQDEINLQEYEPRILKIITNEKCDEKGFLIHPKFELVGVYLRKKFSLNNQLETKEFQFNIQYLDEFKLDMNIWWIHQ